MSQTLAQWLQPEAIALYSALILLASDIIIKREKWLRSVYFLLVVFLLLSVIFVPAELPFGFTSLNLDGFTAVARIILVLLFVVVSLYLASPLINTKTDGLFLSLTFLSLLGSLVMVEASDLLTLLIALEVSSIASYALACYQKSLTELEASSKYFLFGGLASAIFAIGTALLAALSGSTGFENVSSYMTYATNHNEIADAALILILSALAYKVALFPWQLYAPDFYEGQNLNALIFNVVVPKAGGFLALISLFRTFPQSELFASMLAVMIIVSWIYSNLSALAEKSLFRIIALSSISHASFIATSLLLPYNQMQRVSLVYVFVYGISTSLLLGAILSHRKMKRPSILDLAGFVKANPIVAFGFASALISMAGIPPLPVFFGKYFLLKELVLSGKTGIAIVGGLFSAVALGYYLKILKNAFLIASDSEISDEYGSQIPAFAISFNILLVLFFVFYASRIFSLLPPA
ncbi:MAG: proton-conducting transporter membrane subunit [Actinobacteria bacterium]|nr:proton-conducting transporter membrane subunit [Actinomycetota bacterium]